MSNNTSNSDADLTANTSTEETGQTHINPKTGKPFFYKDNPEAVRKRDANRMYVNGKEVSKKHPLHKAGRYKSWDDVHSHNILETVKEGEVYVITNPAWPDWVKIGMAIDAKDRCKGYQTSSPMRDYKVMYSVATQDRRKAEATAHEAAKKIAERRGEWFKMSVGQAKECIQHGL
jgi:hypothetical protein